MLDPAIFSPFILKSKEQVSSTSSIFTLVPAKSAAQSLDLDKLRQIGIWSVQVKQPQLQIARSYTPIPLLSDQLPRETGVKALKLLIRHDANGEVSGYLHRLPRGATIAIRGPKVEYILPEDVDEVLFLAGGTGIAPALQVAQTLVHRMADQRPHAGMRILWANRKREDCQRGSHSVSSSTTSWLGLVVDGWRGAAQRNAETTALDKSQVVRALDHAKSKLKESFSVAYFVDEERSFIAPAVLRSELSRDDVEMKDRRPRRLVLVSGPDGFVNYLAGPKKWQGGQETQGELGGLLKDAGDSGWEVWKL